VGSAVRSPNAGGYAEYLLNQGAKLAGEWGLWSFPIPFFRFLRQKMNFSLTLPRHLVFLVYHKYENIYIWLSSPRRYRGGAQFQFPEQHQRLQKRPCFRHPKWI